MKRLLSYAGQLIRGGVLVSALLVPLVFSAKLPSVFPLPKQTILRLAASAVAIGLAVKRPKIGRGILPYLASWIISAWKSPYLKTAFQGNYVRRSGVIEVVNLFVLYLGSKMVSPRKILSALMLSGAVVTAYALIQKMGLDGHSWRTQAQARPGSTLGNPIFTGGFLAMLISPALLRFLEARYWEQKAGYLLLAGAYAWGVWVTKSRGAYLGAVTGVAAFMANRMKRGRWMLIGLALPLLRVNWKSNRWNIWRDGINAWLKHPLFGVGPDCARPAMNKVKSVATARGESVTSFDRCHNFLIDELVMRGAYGLFTFLRLAWLGFSRQWKSGASDLAGMSAAFLTGNLTAFPTVTTWMAWWMAQGMTQ